MRTLVLFSCLVALAALASADTPAHCLQRQVVGDWTIYEGSTSQLYADLKCSAEDISRKNGLKVRLSNPNVATDAHGNKGTWTMVNDQGFEVTLNGKKYFGFSLWKPKEGVRTTDKFQMIGEDGRVLSHSQVNTNCGKVHAAISSFQKADLSQFGCFYAEKAGAGNVEDMQSSKFLRDDILEDLDSDEDPDLTMFEQSPVAAKRLNAANLGWKATVYEHLKDFTVSEARRMMGGELRGDAFPKTVQQEQAEQAGELQDTEEAKYGNLPRSFDWRNVKGVNYVSEVRSQSDCGGCYTFATLAMIESRLRIATRNHHKPQLSVQSALNCNPYGQGCNGGYPYEVAKFGHDFAFVEESCLKYQSSTSGRAGRCGNTCPNPKYKIRVKNARFVGGYFGGCNEVAMMKEIYTGGPIAIGFKAPMALSMYSGGIYSSEGVQDIMDSAGVKQWEPTSHSVAIVGWGEENGMKFWIVKNSWGQRWGEGGYFRIRRGVDEHSIESAAVAADIDLASSTLPSN